MNELEEHIMQFGSWEHYYQHLLFTYGHTQQQQNAFVLKTHTPEMQSYRGKQNTSLQQSIKGLINSSQQQSLKGKKSAQVRYDGSNEQLKPWVALGISRRWYYTQKSLGVIT